MEGSKFDERRAGKTVLMNACSLDERVLDPLDTN